MTNERNDVVQIDQYMDVAELRSQGVESLVISEIEDENDTNQLCVKC
jgi:hypothetical protein